MNYIDEEYEKTMAAIRRRHLISVTIITVTVIVAIVFVIASVMQGC